MNKFSSTCRATLRDFPKEGLTTKYYKSNIWAFQYRFPYSGATSCKYIFINGYILNCFALIYLAELQIKIVWPIPYIAYIGQIAGLQRPMATESWNCQTVTVSHNNIPTLGPGGNLCVLQVILSYFLTMLRRIGTNVSSPADKDGIIDCAEIHCQAFLLVRFAWDSWL